MQNRFPLSVGFMPQNGGSGPSRERLIARRQWYYGPTCSGKFWFMYDKYGRRETQLSPFFWGYAPKGGKDPN